MIARRLAAARPSPVTDRARLLVNSTRSFSTALQPPPEDDEPPAAAKTVEAAKKVAVQQKRADGGRPGAAQRKEEMAEAADKIESGKSAWQRFCGGMVNTLRPVCAAAWAPVMSVLDRPHRRRVAEAWCRAGRDA